MCGRYDFFRNFESLRRHFKTLEIDSFELNPFTAYPSGQYPVITKNGLQHMTWGFLPEWADKGSKPQINARVETARQKPYFKKACQIGRCLIPANRFTEWESAGEKIPHQFELEANECFAGIYEQNRFCILTKPAESGIARIHDRMPFIVKATAGERWLLYAR